MIIAHFLYAHWSDIVLGLAMFFAVNLRVFPPQFVGYDPDYIDDKTQDKVIQRKQSLLEGVTQLVYTLTRNIIVMISLKGTTSMLIFGLVIFQLIELHTITTNAVILAVVGLVALHFEYIIEQADTVTIWKVFSYKRRQP